MVEFTGTRDTGCPFSALAAVSVLILAVILILILVLVLVIALVAVAVLAVVLVIVLVTVAVLVVHDLLPSSLIFAVFRYSSMPGSSGLILGFEEKAGQKAGKNRCCDTAGSCFQSAGKNSQESVLCNGLPHALCQCVAEAG